MSGWATTFTWKCDLIDISTSPQTLRVNLSVCSLHIHGFILYRLYKVIQNRNYIVSQMLHSVKCNYKGIKKVPYFNVDICNRWCVVKGITHLGTCCWRTIISLWSVPPPCPSVFDSNSGLFVSRGMKSASEITVGWFGFCFFISTDDSSGLVVLLFKICWTSRHGKDYSSPSARLITLCPVCSFALL